MHIVKLAVDIIKNTKRKRGIKMSKLREYRTTEMDLNRLDIEELIKDDEEIKSAITTLQNAIQNATYYSPSYCRRLAFAFIIGIIPERYAYEVFKDISSSYHGICSYIINTMTCDGMTETEMRFTEKKRRECGSYTTTVHDLW